MKKNVIIILVAILFAFLNSCEKIKNSWVDGKGLLQIVGKYKTFDNKVIVLEEIERGLISYSMLKEDEVLFKSKYSFSGYHKWYVIYDNNSDLWFYSGDIGSVYWKRIGDDKYDEVLLTKESISENTKQMPDTLKNDLEAMFEGNEQGHHQN